MLVDPTPVLRRVAEILDSVGIAYFVGGSVASSAHGIQRLTADVDLVAEIAEHQVEALVAACGDEFYADAEMINESRTYGASFNLIHYESLVKVDIYTPYPDDRVRAQMARRTPLTFDPENPEALAPFASAEDVILSKLEWYRMGGGVSDRQWGDVIGVIEVQGQDLDHTYLREWAARLELSDLLERALTEAAKL